WVVAVWISAAIGNRTKGSGAIYQRIFLAIPRSERISGTGAGGDAEKRRDKNFVWTHSADSGDQFASGAITELRGTNGIEFSIAGNRSRFDQDGNDWDRETVERRKAESTDDPASA